MPRTRLDVPSVEHLSIVDEDGASTSRSSLQFPPRTSAGSTGPCFSRGASTSGCSGCSGRAASAPSRPSRARRPRRSAASSRSAPTDWMVPSFRETAAMLWRGWPLEKLLLLYAGYLEGVRSPSPGSTICRSASRSRPRCPTPSASPTRAAVPRRRRVVHGVLRRRRDVRGRLPRGDELRRRLARAGGLLLPEQPVGHLGAAQEADALRGRIAQKALAYGFPGIQVDGNDVLAGLRGHARGGRAGARAATARR